MLSNQTHDLNHGVGNPRNSEGAFVTLRDGPILFAYTRFYGDDDWSDIGTAELVAIESQDQGRTWSKNYRVLVAKEGHFNSMSVSLLRLQDGRIALFYLRSNSFHDELMYMRTSSDEGLTWSEPRLCITAAGCYVVLNDRVIQLSSGRILIPAAYHRPKRHNDDTWDAWDYRAISLFYYSDDAGETWHESADWWALPVATRTGLQEPGVIELKSGEIYAWARTDTGRQWELRSQDQGNHWSPPQRTTFQSPNSSLSLKRIPATGDLLAVWNDRSRRWKLPDPVVTGRFEENSSWGRTPLVMAISSNEGKTWKKHKLIESNHRQGFCYTALHFVEGAILMAYCYGGEQDGVLQNTRIRRIALDWLYR